MQFMVKCEYKDLLKKYWNFFLKMDWYKKKLFESKIENKNRWGWFFRFPFFSLLRSHVR